MGIFDKLGKMVLGMKDIDVSGNMQVATLQKRFKEAFGTEIRVYKSINTGKGSRPADPKSTLASIGTPGIKVADITIKKSKAVGTIEDEFKEKMGIGIQIMTPDGKSFADNDMELQNVAKL